MQIFVRLGNTSVFHRVRQDATTEELAEELSSKLEIGHARHDVVSKPLSKRKATEDPERPPEASYPTFCVFPDLALQKVNYFWWFQAAGRRLREGKTLLSAGVQEGSTLQLHLRLRGGGGDGGATGAESRSSYLEMYMEKKPDKVDPAEERLARATTCKLSGQKLQTPCVGDELGSLYNKEAVVSALVAKSMPKALGHISSLKHVTDAKLCPIKDAPADSSVAFCCPITEQPLNGQHRFCMLLPSGHVISEKAFIQVPEAVEELVGEGKVTKVPLNGTKEEVEGLWDLLIAKRAAAKKSKKDRKRPIGVAVVASSDSAVAAVTNASDDSPPAAARVNGKRQVQDFRIPVPAKKIKAAEMAPAHADKKIWASLFTSGHGTQAKETYSCRSTSARGWI